MGSCSTIMLSTEMNERLTRVEPGTPCGVLLRNYWQPVALTQELVGPRPVKAVRMLGEDLVFVRDEAGRLGLIDRHCCHRGADLRFGRLEDGGIRCPFHGWLFDVDGACLEQPAEPVGSTFHRKVRQPSYPCCDVNGVILAYFGVGDPPPLGNMDCFSAPDSHSFAFKGLLECNWLQALEAGIDPAHASFLHRVFEDADEEVYGQQFGATAANTGVPVTQVLRKHPVPRIEVEETAYGLRLFALRDLDDGSSHIRVTNLVFPNVFVIPMSNDMIITQWLVPVDDENSYWYAMFSDFRNLVDQEKMREQRLASCTLPDYHSVKHRGNDWGYDPEEQRRLSYTGMGWDINIHDQWAVESPGSIQDRTKEHLGTTDKAIIANRKILQRAIEVVEQGQPAPCRPEDDGHVEGLVAIDTVVARDRWREEWQGHDQERRRASSWARSPWREEPAA